MASSLCDNVTIEYNRMMIYYQYVGIQNYGMFFDIQHQQITVLDPAYLLEYTDFDCD
ncbi:hypothetical protein [Paenibacillus sp. FSL R5-0470]|uniref:hypothetical protein n=1 Tax=Paenibacillus sp. FSL R5-0470 TaxID=2921641 RepID=UPI0030D86F52